MIGKAPSGKSMPHERAWDPGPASRDHPAPAAVELAEQALVRQIAERQVTAFDALFRCYHPRLARFINRVTLRPGLVDELINDTMFVVWNRAATYNGQSKVSTWVFAIAYRKALKALQGLDEPVADDLAHLRPSEEAGPQEQREQQELRATLRRALDALSADQRAVVDLTYFHGADYREIAEIVDCPVATVKTRMFHARRRLRALLSSLEDWR
jgi:RNA polymerase sigma factor (sigma-70 family)